MRFVLLPFQEETAAVVVEHLRLSMEEVARTGASGTGQAVTLVAPTGAGKTVMAAAVLEILIWGDGTSPGDDELTVVWLSDLPGVNEQTRRKIARASDRLGDDRLVQVDTSFSADELIPGRVYFLNTQKLSVSSNLVSDSEERSFTIWETINRTIARNASRFLLVIDEAHRGMERSSRVAEAEANSIVQRFIMGSPEMARTPIILGISATPKRFDELVAGTRRTVRRAEADVNEVRASGLIKEKIVVWRPEHGLTHAEATLLQRAAQSWQDYQIRWSRYTMAEQLSPIHPILVVQVEDKTGDRLTATDLAQAIESIEEVTGQLYPDAYAHSFGDAPSGVLIGSRKIRYLRPSEIDGDPQVSVVFFKTSLSTGWDCPRAEVIMSFRTARDTTFIAQLVGRMVRTPLARRVESDESLNSVALYLPKYDRGAVQSIIKQLKSGDPEFVPAVDAEEGDGLIDCERHEGLYSQIRTAAERLRSFIVPRERRMAPVARLDRLAGSLSDLGLWTEAPQEMESQLLRILSERLANRRGDAEFEAAVSRSREVGLNATTLSYLTGETVTETIRVVSTSRSLERLFDQIGKRIGAGLHEKLWRQIRSSERGMSGDEARTYVIGVAAETATLRLVEERARILFEDWLARFEGEIDELSEGERQEFDKLREHGEGPAERGFKLPTSVRARSREGATDWPFHLFQTDEGFFPDRLNKWETSVVESELARDGLVCWMRNKERQSWALTVPYEISSGQFKSMYPDFLFFRKSIDGVTVALIDPHGVHLEDAPLKARGLARYAQRYGHHFGRIELVIYDRDADREQALNLKSPTIRDEVAKVTTHEHLRSLFDLASS